MTGRVLEPEEIEAIVRKAVRAEFSNAGLLIDEDEHVFQVRDDFRFLRKLRMAIDGASSRVGQAVLMAALAGFVSAFWMGFKMLSK
jgi:hypothetical protein